MNKIIHQLRARIDNLYNFTIFPIIKYLINYISHYYIDLFNHYNKIKSECNIITFNHLLCSRC